MEAVHAFTKVRESAAGRRKPAPKTIERIAPGEAIRQGDLYVIRIASLPRGARLVENPPAQLVPGRSRGSRHVITRGTFHDCTLFALDRPTDLDGPVIEARAPFEISHPEHGHFILPAGLYAVRYQRRYSERERRVRD